MPRGVFLNGPNEGDTFEWDGMSFPVAYLPPLRHADPLPTYPVQSSTYVWMELVVGIRLRLDREGRMRPQVVTREGWFCRG